MFSSLGSLTYRRRRGVLALGVLFLLVAGLWGTGVFARMVGGGFDDPDSESSRAGAALEQALGRDAADVVVLYRADGPVSEHRADIEAVLEDLPPGAVTSVATTWSTGSPALVSIDGRSTYAVLGLPGGTDDERETAYDVVADRLDVPGLETLIGGAVPGDVTTNEQVGEDIARAETLSLPVLAVLLVLVFGGLVAAGLPLLVGAFSVLGAFLVLHVLSYATDISVFALNIVTLLGLGLAIDYALFMVSRFREELAAGRRVEQAVERTVATAGRTVAFSGLIVTVALAGLLVFPQVFLRSMGLGGMAAVAVAAVTSLTVLPAVLGMLGHRVDRLRVLPRRASSGLLWARLARAVMRRPVLVMVATVGILLAIGLPFLRIEFGTVDARVLPAGNEVRVVQESLLGSFPSQGTAPIAVAVLSTDNLPAYEDTLRALPGVVAVEQRGSSGGITGLTVTQAGDPLSGAARDLVAAVRSAPGADVLVGGTTAEFVDLNRGLADRLPVAGLLVVTTMLVLLFLAFGSVLLPVKAVLVNVLSLSAMFGGLVWIFQEGHLTGLLGIDTVGPIESTQPILILALAFGLSMDYEVFLLSRIREEWDATHDNALAVERGLARTGGLISSAAVLFAVVVGAFATSGVVFIQMIGIGLVIAVAVDATLVRGLLVPATMRLLGSANWWAPAPLARVYARFGVREEPVGASPERELVTAGR
ncbi:MAG TPA: MMPL family transporter [Mycobacteriales bacterium]|jgi:RND superfamily putative drug exporter|nr:MMPL family transporter [Mycobacteriales bacterium]